MIVLDASAVVELLTNGPLAKPIRSELSARGEPLLVPHLIDVEAANALRRLAAAGRLHLHDCRQLLAALADLPAERCPHVPLLSRIWELRHNFTAYDSTYIALAEATQSALFTCDEKLRKGHRASVVVFTAQ